MNLSGSFNPNEKQISAAALLSSANTFDTDSSFIKHELLTNSTVFYIPETFTPELLVTTIEEFFTQNSAYQFSKHQNNDILTYSYTLKKGLLKTVGLSNSYNLYLMFFKNQLLMLIKPANWAAKHNSTEKKINFKNLVNNSGYNQISEFLIQRINDTCKLLQTCIFIQANYYVEFLSTKFQNWFYVNSNTHEIILVVLGISEIKKIREPELITKPLQWYYILTSQQALIVAFNPEFDLVYFENISFSPLKVKNEFGRDPVIAGAVKWLTNRDNDFLYQDVQHINDADSQTKLRELARLNRQVKEKELQTINAAIQLYQLLIQLSNDPFDELTLYFIQFTDKDKAAAFSESAQNDHLHAIIKKILKHPDFCNRLENWYENWKLSTTETVAFLQLLLKSATEFQEQQALNPFYKSIRSGYLKHEKDKSNLILFDLEYCNHLITIDKKTEAEKILNELLTKLPDESLSEIIPPSDINISGPASGQLLRVLIYRLLSKTVDSKNNYTYLLRQVQLQPLFTQNVITLHVIADTDVKYKANEIYEILKPEYLASPTVSFNTPANINVITELKTECLVHPVIRQSSVVKNIQKWLATSKFSDSAILKQYSELLTPDNYPEVYSVVQKVTTFFGISGLEIFIARGEKAIGIQAYESANGVFLLIGYNHIDTKSGTYLNTNELTFALASEMAYIHYKFVRISAIDVWRGALEKGVVALDAISGLFPVLGVLEKSIQHIGKLRIIARWIQKTQYFQKILTASSNTLAGILQTVSIYENQGLISQNNPDLLKLEFLAVSRTMQLTADRAGLLFANDIKAAIRTMFLTSPSYSVKFKDIAEIGLEAYLTQTDNDNQFINQHLAIRIAHLFTFYLSDEFTRANSEIYSKA